MAQVAKKRAQTPKADKKRKWVAVKCGKKTWGLGRSGGTVEARIRCEVGDVDYQPNVELVQAIVEGLNKAGFDL